MNGKFILEEKNINIVCNNEMVKTNCIFEWLYEGKKNGATEHSRN